jgi:predicted secreted protein
VRDYEQWLQGYDDPASGLSWRLRTVQAAIAAALDRTSGPVRLVSACAGAARARDDVVHVPPLASVG